MPIQKLLIANRGEIAVRIARAAADGEIRSVAVFAQDDAASLHVGSADEALALEGLGAAAYLDITGMVSAAQRAGCDAVHPGYGFLSENAAFARACGEAGLVFVGPRPEVLALFGDKVRARAYAAGCGVPLARGTNGATSLAEVQDFFASLGSDAAVMIKAVAGGGGRGMRAVTRADDLSAAYERCRSEALAAFGIDHLYVEEIVREARHVEIQIIGDGTGAVSHLHERECSLQRRHQKLVEIAPCPDLSPTLRAGMVDAAVTMARQARYGGLGTFEFLVGRTGAGEHGFVFMEANPRVQVEHTVTEQILGIDLVQAQLGIAGGSSLAEIGLTQAEIPAPRGYAIQLRINMEAIQPDGTAVPAAGTLARFEPATGPGIRVDSFGYAGYETSTRYDSLLAKLIVSTPNGSFHDAVRRTRRALGDFHVEGVETNIGFLKALLDRPEIAENAFSIAFVGEHLATLSAAAAAQRSPAGIASGEDGIVRATMQGVLVGFAVEPGDLVAAGQAVAIVEAMKMESVIASPVSGRVSRLLVDPRGPVRTGQPLLAITPDASVTATVSTAGALDLDHVRPDLQEVFDRRAAIADSARPTAIAKRKARGHRTARENVADLLDPGSFVEYGAHAVPAQRERRPLDELKAAYPADGLIAGIGTVGAAHLPAEKARCLVLAYDYTVLAGTQGIMSHRKKDRMLQLALQWRMPVVLFAEGGGGRPGDTDHLGVSGLESMTFRRLAALSGQVPLIGIASGRCFAGNAALLGCCDLVIATRDASIGMAGPAMIEGGGLGTFLPEEVGPTAVQAANGVIDVVVTDEAEAVAVAKRYLGLLQAAAPNWTSADQRRLRHVVPENRLRIYDVRVVIEVVADTDSVLELRAGFAPGMITALARIEGRTVGIVANNCQHLAGAIDADGADKAARFLQLCEAFAIPIVSLCDTPGFMVGPEAEKTGLVRHVSRLFVGAAALSVPVLLVVMRKAYGLGAMAMAAGSTHVPLASIAWPSAEFGGMGIEGAIRLAYRAEIEAVADPKEREALFNSKVAQLYAHGKALNVATYLEIDEVVDPAETRGWISRSLSGLPERDATQRARPRFIDTW